MRHEDFRKWFNRDFWKAFRNMSIPVGMPDSKEGKSALVREVFEAVNSARYSVSIPEIELVVNKGHGVARTVPVFSIRDYIVYYFCIKELEQILAINRTPNTFGGWTLGGRLRRMEDDDIEADSPSSGSRYAFNPRAWSEAFGEFSSLLYSQLDTGKFPYILQFDLSNFYDSVRLDILERWIREESGSSKGWVVALLFYFLNQWNRKNTGLHPQAVGIPQDALADCSRILANYYLQKYDKYAHKQCELSNSIYFRYSDDQFILLQNCEHYEQLMLLLTRRLDQYGLRVNQKKVRLWEKSELERHRLRTLHAIFKNKEDRKCSALTNKYASEYLSLPNEFLKSSWNQGIPALNRVLWANIPEITQPNRDMLISRLMEKDFLKQASHKQMERIYKIVAPKDKDKLIGQLLALSDQLIHNSFHYEAHFFGSAIGSKEFCTRIDSRITQIKLIIEKGDFAMKNY